MAFDLPTDVDAIADRLGLSPLARAFLRTPRPVPILWLNKQDWREMTPKPLAKEDEQ